MADTPKQPTVENTLTSPARVVQPIRQVTPVTAPASITLQPPVTNKNVKKSFGKKHAGLLLITRQQLFIYIEGIEAIATYVFTPDVVRDLDVINEELLHEKIVALIAKEHLPPANFYVVLANQTLFSKQITATDVSQKKVEEEKFLNTIPFETPSVRNITMGSNTYIVVANEQLFSAFEESFEKEGSEFSIVLPEFLFAKELNLAQGISVASAQVLLKKMQEFKAFSFVKKNLPDESPGAVGGADKKFKLQVSGGKSNRLFIIIGVLVMLIGVLVAGFLLIQQNKPVPTPPAPAPVEEVQAPSPTEVTGEFQASGSASEEASLASPSADVQGDTSSDITIQYTEQNAYTATILAGRLQNSGFSFISLERVASNGTIPQVNFQPIVSSPVEKIIMKELYSQYSRVEVKRNKSAADDVVIILGNNGKGGS